MNQDASNQDASNQNVSNRNASVNRPSDTDASERNGEVMGGSEPQRAGARAARNVAVRISPDAVRQVRGGSPWIFDGSIDSVTFDAAPGTVAVLFDRKRQFVGVGLYDPTSPIRVRVLHVGDQVRLDDDFIADRIEAAVAHRADLFAELDADGEPLTTAGRLVNGENDRLPGLIVDRYADTAVIKLYTLAWSGRLDLIADVITASTDVQRVVVRLARSVAVHSGRIAELTSPSAANGASAVDSGSNGNGTVLRGSAPTGPVVFRENGLWFEADVIAGQKTGHFLDQRENRARVRDLAAGDQVLDVFAATGGFSVYALAGGAASVTLIDQSTASLARARSNLALNGFDGGTDEALATTGVVSMIAGDAFAELETLVSARRRFDLVIVDPPSFAPSKAAEPKALAAYARLTEMALAVLHPGGLLVQCSCSSRIGADVFFDTVHAAAERAGRPLGEFDRTFHPMDHPIGFEFGAYLKAIFAYVP